MILPSLRLDAQHAVQLLGAVEHLEELALLHLPPALQRGALLADVARRPSLQPRESTATPTSIEIYIIHTYIYIYDYSLLHIHLYAYMHAPRLYLHIHMTHDAKGPLVGHGDPAHGAIRHGSALAAQAKRPLKRRLDALQRLRAKVPGTLQDLKRT